MHLSPDDQAALAELDARLKILLPPAYADSYETLNPAPMKSAGLKFDLQGEVAWSEIWGSFCDLALAGGPPHKGALLGPASAGDVDARATGTMLDLPVAPSFRLDREIKNVVTVSAKTSHYWLEHMPRAQQRA